MKKETVHEVVGCVVAFVVALGMFTAVIAVLGLSYRLFRWIAGV